MEASNQPPEDRERELVAREQQVAAREEAIKRAEATAAAGLDHEPEVPTADHPPETPEEVQQLAEAFAEYRKEVAALRNELAAHRKRPPVAVIAQETPEERANARLELIAQNTHYCPGCGALGKYPQRCTGTAEGPHKPIEMVSTDELGGDPANHTAAPSTDPDELAA